MPKFLILSAAAWLIASPAAAAFLALQDFDGATDAPGWAYTIAPDPAATGVIEHPGRHFGVTDDLGNFTLGSGDFLGVRDAGDRDRPDDPAVFVRFAAVDVAGRTDLELRFDYRARDFDPGESVGYEVFVDGLGRGVTPLVTGQADRSDVSGTHTLPLPAGSETIALTLIVTQRGVGDYTGFDNVAILGSVVLPEPGAAVWLGLGALVRLRLRSSEPLRAQPTPPGSSRRGEKQKKL
ncbi:MAG: hypothetical protein AAGE65_00705 [Planctomycetota bacterium]